MDTSTTENVYQLAIIDIVFQIVDIVLNTFLLLSQQVMTIFFSALIPG